MTAPKSPAIERAAEAIQRKRDRLWPCPLTPEDELRALSPELLRELADEFALDPRQRETRGEALARILGDWFASPGYDADKVRAT